MVGIKTDKQTGREKDGKTDMKKGIKRGRKQEKERTLK